MKTNPPSHQQPLNAETTISDEFQTLLQQHGSIAASNRPADGIAIGQLLNTNTDGSVQVAIPSLGLHNLKAMTLVDLSKHPVNAEVALGFQHNNYHLPIVLGALLQAKPNMVEEIEFDDPEQELEPEIDYAVIDAGKSLEIRCGKAVILLEADGTIKINGTYITSHASATHRILGGSVNIN